MRKSDPNPTRNGLHPSLRRIRNPELRFSFSSSSAAAGARQRKAAASSSAATPQLGWKFMEADSAPCRVSARKLAAGIWHSETLETEPNVGHQLHAHGLKQGSNRINDFSRKNQSTVVYPDPLMERATKWDSKSVKPSNEISQSFDHWKCLIDRQMMTQASSVEFKLKAELDWAKARIAKLEAKRRSSKKELEHILEKHAEEKASWRRKEHAKTQAFIDGMKADLIFERKNRRRTEILNSKLLDEIAEAKKSAKRFLHDYEKEKKARELLEDVCDQLAEEVGEDRAEVEESKRESIRARDELEEERKMLQMAEAWREERVQMKLIDAKLALENQCSQLKKLQVELESFLRSRMRTSLDATEIMEAETLIEAVAESVKIQDMKEFTYQPPQASDDVYAIFEELLQREEPTERDIEQYNDKSPASNAHKIHTTSPGTDIFLGKPTNGSIEDDSEWETLSRGELGSSLTEASGESPCEINEDLRKSMSSISKLWPSCPEDGKNYKRTSVDVPKEVVSNGGLADAGFSPSKFEHWSSSDSENPQVTRGMKGCIDWPRGIHKHNLKSKLLEARLESHKVQIRHVLKQKI